MVSQSLKEWGRELWIQEEMTLLKDPQTYSPDFEKAWKKVKGGASLPGLTAKGFWFLGKLAAQREHLTSTHNIPRRHWLKDERICDLVLLFEKTPETLPQQPLPKEVKDCVEKILSESETISFADMPLPPGKRKALASELNTYGLLSTLLKECAARSAVAPKLIATREDLESLIWSYQKKKNPAPDTPLMVGWRYDLFGIHAMKLLKESLL
jgi:ribonuclease D